MVFQQRNAGIQGIKLTSIGQQLDNVMLATGLLPD